MKTFDSAGYIRKKYRQFMIRVDRDKDPDIIQKLESVDNLTGYIRSLVYDDVRNHPHDDPLQDINPVIREYMEDANNGKEKERL